MTCYKFAVVSLGEGYFENSIWWNYRQQYSGTVFDL